MLRFTASINFKLVGVQIIVALIKYKSPPRPASRTYFSDLVVIPNYPRSNTELTPRLFVASCKWNLVFIVESIKSFLEIVESSREAYVASKPD